jgi:Flp pilus assembly protein TadB
VVVDLLAATLASGAAMRSSLAAVCVAVEEPAAACLSEVVAALDLGADPVEAWATVEHDPVLGALGAAAVRSARTGAPLSLLLSRLAEDMRRDRRAVVEVAARTAGVRAVIPLVACFLPAFILLGVVPVVAGLANELIGS